MSLHFILNVKLKEITRKNNILEAVLDSKRLLRNFGQTDEG